MLASPTRAERALVQVVAEAYVRGVSTRRVEGLVQTLGIASLSRSQVSELARDVDGMVEDFRHRPLDHGPYTYLWTDAISLKVREGRRVVNIALLHAVGVNRDGHCEMLGLEPSTAEDGAGWLAFWRSLVARGLSGVQLVTSDAHHGLVNAIAGTMTGAAWRRSPVMMAAAGWLLNNQLAEFDDAIAAAVACHPDAAIFSSFPGVGATLTGVLLAEIGEHRDRFPSPAGRRCMSLDSLVQARVRLPDPRELDQKEHPLAALAPTG